MIEIEVETQRWVTDPGDPSDAWDRDNTDGCVSGVVARYLADGEPKTYYGMGWGDGSYDVDALPGDVVHVVVAQYATGDTFGNDGCQISVMDVFKDAREAVELLEALENRDDRDSFGLTHNDRDYYIPWDGYFEYLESLDIHTLVVQNGVSR